MFKRLFLLLLFAAIGLSALINEEDKGEVDKGEEVKGELSFENKDIINEYFQELLQDGIQNAATATSLMLTHVLKSLREVNWVRLICEVDIILDEPQKAKLQRDIK